MTYMVIFGVREWPEKTRPTSMGCSTSAVPSDPVPPIWSDDLPSCIYGGIAYPDTGVCEQRELSCLVSGMPIAARWNFC